MTAYARECERVGVRIARWRDQTGCRNLIPFKYSGEHYNSGESSHVNATDNEVINLNVGGGEEYGDEMEERLDLTRLGDTQPAYRAVYTSPPPSRKVYATSPRSKRKRKMRRLRRLERKRDKERKRKLKERRRSREGSKRERLGSMNGVVLKRVKVGGAKNKLRWGGGGSKDQSRPPFELFLREEASKEEEEEKGKHGEEDSEFQSAEAKNSLDAASVHRSRLPKAKGRTPIPLKESESAEVKAAEIHRKNWKRRRSIN